MKINSILIMMRNYLPSDLRKLLLAIPLMFSAVFVQGQVSDSEIDKIIQEGSPSKLITTNSELLLNGRFKHAARIAEKLVQISPDNSNYNYRLGYSLLQCDPDIEAPIKYLAKASQQTAAKYDASSDKEVNAPYDAIYYYGWALHRAGRIDEAIVTYNKFNEIVGKKNVLRAFADLKLEQCEVAKELMTKPTHDKLKNIGSNINTEGPEYSAVIAIDGSALYFTSRRFWTDSIYTNLIDPATDNYLEDIYMSFLDYDEEWTESFILDFCRHDQNEATVSVSIDERRIYVYNDLTGNGDIYYTDYARGKFNDITAVEKANVNSPSWEPHLMVAPDGNTILFVSDRAGGFGGRDIYRINKLPDGSWSKPQNLGPKINTPFDEDSPFLAIDNKTLYFASNGPKSMGGFDIFVSIADEDGNWSDPINMGSPINSPGDDAFYTTTADGFKGYITSFRQGGMGDLDIYEIEHFPPRSNNIAMLKGQIFVLNDQPLPEDISIKVKCLNCDNASVIEVFPRIRDGVFSSKLEKCKEYELVYTYNKGQTVFHTSKLTTHCLPEYEELYMPVYLRLDDMKIVPNYSLKIKTLEVSTQNIISNVTVEIMDASGMLLETVQTDGEGLYLSSILKNGAKGDIVNLKFKVSKEGYLTKTSEVSLTLADENELYVELLLEKADLGDDLAKLLNLNTIYFDLNSSFIRQDARIELEKVIKVLNDNPNLSIECGSHTDCRASYEYNEWLSERRAQSTVKYIKKRITNPERVTGKGYGETQLVNNCPCEGEVQSNCSEEDHQLNRRTEFRIVKK